MGDGEPGSRQGNGSARRAAARCRLVSIGYGDSGLPDRVVVCTSGSRGHVLSGAEGVHENDTTKSSPLAATRWSMPSSPWRWTPFRQRCPLPAQADDLKAVAGARTHYFTSVSLEFRTKLTPRGIRAAVRRNE